MEQTCTVHVQHCQRLKTFLYKPITDLKKTANLTASTLLRVSATACPSSKLLSLYLLATGSNFNTTRQILTFVNRNCSVSLTQDADKVSNLSRIDLSPNRIWLKIPSASSKFKNLLPYYHPILIGHACFT